MALYSFSEVFVWDNLGGFVRLARNQRVEITDPDTGTTAAGLVDSSGGAVSYITTDADGRAEFGADVAIVRPIINGNTLPDLTSPDAGGGGSAIAYDTDGVPYIV